jgi:glycosyltransferase involved in cell wall biosynthesis
MAHRQTVHLTHRLSAEGAGLGTAVLELAITECFLGRPAICATCSAPDNPVPTGVEIMVGRTKGPESLGFSPELEAKLCGIVKATDVIHLHGIWTFMSRTAFRVAKRQNSPLIISPHGMLEPWALQLSRFKKRIARFLFEDKCLRSAFCLRALTEKELQDFRAFGLHNPVAVIANGVTFPDKVKGKKIPDPAPKEWRDRRLLLFLSRIHPKKGLDLFIRGWRRAGAERYGWTLAIAGPDQLGHMSELKLLIDELQISRTVRFVGPQFGENKEAWFQRADAFVLPSLSEGFPMAILEAMAHALPVLLTPQCNFPEAEVCDAAIKIEPEPADIARGLLELFTMSDEDRASMGQRGLKLVKQRYTWSKIATDMLSVYQWALGGGMPPDCVIMK